MSFEDVRFYNTPFIYVCDRLKLNAFEAIGTPAEPITCQLQHHRYENAPLKYDKCHAIDMVAGDIRNFDDCHTVQLKTFTQVQTPRMSVGLRFEPNDEYSQVARVMRYCEYQNVRLGLIANVNYPKTYVSIQWNKTKPRDRPAWFLVVDTISLYAALTSVVEALAGDSHMGNDLLHRKIFEARDGHDGCYEYKHERLTFTTEFLAKLQVPYYVFPVGKDNYVGMTDQCGLF